MSSNVDDTIFIFKDSRGGNRLKIVVNNFYTFRNSCKNVELSIHNKICIIMNRKFNIKTIKKYASYASLLICVTIYCNCTHMN